MIHVPPPVPAGRPVMNRKPIVVGLFLAAFFWAPLALMIWWRL